MIRTRGLALKLALLILSSITLIFSVIFIYNYFLSRRIIINNVEKNAHSVASATVNRIDVVLHAVEKVPENLACFLESSSHDRSYIMTLIRSVVEHNPEIYGATIAFEPYAYSGDSLHFAPYFFRSGGKVEFTYIPYDYFYSDWYQIPKELNRPIWTEPYYDEGAGEIIMATYSVPFYKTCMGKREFMGIVTADISLSWLQEMVASIKIAKTGYGFLISKDGTFVTHPLSNLIMNETIFSVAEARGDARLRELGRAMIQGQSGFAPLMSSVTEEKCWMVYAPLSASGWSLGVLFPQDELMADISRLNRTVVFLSLAGFLVILAVIIWISGSITKPLRALSKATEQIGSGNLDIEIPPIKSRDEVGKLADSFNYMTSSLKKYIKELTETTAAKERIESELKIAHDIQMSMLHKLFPPFPDRKEFGVYATLCPARQVGGDLYDFFFIDDDHICFTIGDVSDKGVPAAFFMAVSKTLIKTRAARGLTPDIVLTRVNQDLSIDNPSMMFVTLFFAILNVRTGEVIYSNGGHNLPFLLTREGFCNPLKNTPGIALGVMEDATFESRTIVLEKGDKLFLYTDGVTEAINRNEDLFSEQRLQDALASCGAMTVREVVEEIGRKVETFTKGMEQFDDITMLALEFYGPD